MKTRLGGEEQQRWLQVSQAAWAFLHRECQEKYNAHNLYLSHIIVPWQALGVSR